MLSNHVSSEPAGSRRVTRGGSPSCTGRAALACARSPLRTGVNPRTAGDRKSRLCAGHSFRIRTQKYQEALSRLNHIPFGSSSKTNTPVRQCGLLLASPCGDDIGFTAKLVRTCGDARGCGRIRPAAVVPTSAGDLGPALPHRSRASFNRSGVGNLGYRQPLGRADNVGSILRGSYRRQPSGIHRRYLNTSGKTKIVAGGRGFRSSRLSMSCSLMMSPGTG